MKGGWGCVLEFCVWERARQNLYKKSAAYKRKIARTTRSRRGITAVMSVIESDESNDYGLRNELDCGKDELINEVPARDEAREDGATREMLSIRVSVSRLSRRAMVDETG